MNAFDQALLAEPFRQEPEGDGVFPLAEILREIETFILRFVVLSQAQATVAALWVAHTHAFDAAEMTPYLSITSAEKQSGKTRLLEVLELIVAKPWFTGRASTAVLVRKIHRLRPTLLLDESDAAFGGDRDYAEALRQVLNNGYRQGGTHSLCAKNTSGDFEDRDFSVFCPKAIAGIGKLPETIADRSFPIRLKRKGRQELTEKLRRRDVEPLAVALSYRLRDWAAESVEELRTARPDLPERLSDRAGDTAEPLLAIADLAGADWPERARRSILELCTGDASADESKGVQLLRDVLAVFEANRTHAIHSANLAEELNQIEGSPWADWNNGKGITPNQIARLLKIHEIRPSQLRIGETNRQGYRKEWFEDAWSRYVPNPAGLLGGPPSFSPGPQTLQTLQPPPVLAPRRFSEVLLRPSCSTPQDAESSTETGFVDPVGSAASPKERRNGDGRGCLPPDGPIRASDILARAPVSEPSGLPETENQCGQCLEWRLSRLVSLPRAQKIYLCSDCLLRHQMPRGGQSEPDPLSF